MYFFLILVALFLIFILFFASMINMDIQQTKDAKKNESNRIKSLILNAHESHLPYLEKKYGITKNELLSR